MCFKILLVKDFSLPFFLFLLVLLVLLFRVFLISVTFVVFVFESDLIELWKRKILRRSLIIQPGFMGFFQVRLIYIYIYIYIYRYVHTLGFAAIAATVVVLVDVVVVAAADTGRFLVIL